MALLRRIARPMVSAVYLTGGIAELRDPAGHAKRSEAVLATITPKLPVGCVAGNPGTTGTLAG